jgi:glucuronate isomerase
MRQEGKKKQKVCLPVQKTSAQARIDAVTILHDDRLFPSEPTIRSIARRLYREVRDLPLLSPHGHTEARWFAENEPFPNPTTLLIVPDHYVFRMLYSQGIAMEDLGIGKKELDADEARKIWILFAKSYDLFRGTPTRMWLDYAFQEQFGLQERLSAANAEAYYDTISAKLASPAFRPRAGDHQPAAGSVDLPPGHPRFRMECPHCPHFSSRFGGRP